MILQLYNLIGASDRSRTCTPKALDPKSSASASSATPAYLMVPAKGLEPSTYWLQVSCSTNWAKPAYFILNGGG